MSTSYDRGATLHGARRVRKRMKLPARALRRLIEQAREHGARYDQMPAWLKILVTRKQERFGTAFEYVYFRDFLFVFGPDNGPLITTYVVREDDPELEQPDWHHIRTIRRFY